MLVRGAPESFDANHILRVVGNGPTSRPPIIVCAETKSKVSRLHAFLKQKEFIKVKQLLLDEAIGRDDPSVLLWTPTSSRSGWTAVHLAARALLSEQYAPSPWWAWICKKASPSRNFVTARDKSGETVFSIFFGAWLTPPIGATGKFQQFEQTLSNVTNSSESMERLKDWVQTKERTTSFLESPHEQMVARFWLALNVLCRAAHEGSGSSSCYSIVHVLAQLDSCPEAVARLVLGLEPEMASTRPYPLHIWCHTSMPFQMDPSANGLLAPLLKAFPQAVHTDTDIGSYPLHVALQTTNKPLAHIDLMWNASPAALGTLSSKNLPAWALVAMAIRTERREWVIARRTRNASVSLYDWLDSCRRERAGDGDEMLEELDCLHLTFLFRVVRAWPEAVLPSVSEFVWTVDK
jgi:hypothetical protein